MDGAISLNLQVGRRRTAEGLAERAVDGEIILVIEPRRVGKSSTIGRGALPLAHERFGAMTTAIDLRLSAIGDAGSLAASLRDAALAPAADGTPTNGQREALAAVTDRYEPARRAARAADLVDHAGRFKADHPRLADLRSATPALRDVLFAFEIEAHVTERPVIAFFDEVQDVGDLTRFADGEEIQHELERALRRPGRMTSYIFAGSDQAAMSQVFAAGQPLHHEGERYMLPAIPTDAWVDELPKRFAADGRTIDGPR